MSFFCVGVERAYTLLRVAFSRECIIDFYYDNYFLDGDCCGIDQHVEKNII